MPNSRRKSEKSPKPLSNETQRLTAEVIDAYGLGQAYIARLNALIAAALLTIAQN